MGEDICQALGFQPHPVGELDAETTLPQQAIPARVNFCFDEPLSVDEGGLWGSVSGMPSASSPFPSPLPMMTPSPQYTDDCTKRNYPLLRQKWDDQLSKRIPSLAPMSINLSAATSTESSIGACGPLPPQGGLVETLNLQSRIPFCPGE